MSDMELVYQGEIVEEDGSWYEAAVSKYIQADEDVADGKWRRCRTAHSLMARATETGDRSLLNQFAGDVRRSASHLRHEAFAQELKLRLESMGRPTPSSLSPGFYVEAAKSLGTRTAVERGDEDAIRLTGDALDKAEDEHWTVSTMRENHRALGTGENEWYTPQDVLEDVRELFGGIGLDPASSEVAQAYVKAERHFTREDDALAQAWDANTVFLNPPYSRDLIGAFVKKLTGEFRANRFTEAILLTHNYTDTEWFHVAESEAAAICFTRGRIKFVSPDGELAAPTQGQAFFYYGPRVQEFQEAFGHRGFIR